MEGKSMRVLRTSLFALAVCSAGLAGCSPGKSSAWEPAKKVDPARFEAAIDALKAAPFSFKADAIEPVDAIFAALPKSVQVTHDAATFDAATGATAVTNVRISPADRPDVGVQIQQIRLWGLDDQLATARLGGQRLDETASLARRVEITGASAFGLANLMNPMMDAYTGAVAGAIEDALGEQSEPMPQMEIGRYDFSIGKIILDDVVLRPWAMVPAKLEADSEWAEVMPLLQTYSAFYRSFAVDQIATYDMKFEFVFSEQGLEQTVLGVLDVSGTKGMRGADTDFSFLRGMRFDFNMQVPSEPLGDPSASLDDPILPSDNATDAPPATTEPPTLLRLTGGIERTASSGMRLDKVMGYLARGEMPPRTETDLLSLGTTRMEKQAFALNGANVYSVADATVDFSGFHWFIPTRARFGANDVVYDIKGIVDAVTAMDPEAFAQAADAGPSVAKVMETLAKYALDKPSFDYDLGWTWDAKSGDAKVDLAYGLDQFIRMKIDFAGGFPSFDAASALIPDDPEAADPAALSKLFSEKSTLKSATVDITDEGGLAKGFGLAVDIGKLMPAGDPATGFLQSTTPESLRTMASSGIYMVGSQAGAEIPAAKAALDAVAGFVAKGGKLSFRLAPKEPVLWSSLDATAADPTATFDRLGYSVQHVAPPEPKTPAKKN
jgi:hypothetical protein